MHLTEIIIIGIALSMDACCVCFSHGMRRQRLSLSRMLLTALLFGLFQGMMPILGSLSGTLFVTLLSRYSYWLVFFIFLALGGKMLFDAVWGEQSASDAPATIRLLALQAIATSIDALAVGISFSAMQVNVRYAATLIALITFFLSFSAICLGRKVGTRFNKQAGLIGSILLLFIAIKALADGLIAI